MTGFDTSAPRSSSSDPGLRVTLPGSRGGLAWLVVLLVVGTFLAFQVGRQVYASWSINQQADVYRAQIAALEAQNDAYQRELDYLQSDAFVSAEARRIQNIGRADEQVLIIPPGTAADPPAAVVEEGAPVTPPILQWVELFFDR
jgi:cell division protein FtsB